MALTPLLYFLRVYKSASEACRAHMDPVLGLCALNACFAQCAIDEPAGHVFARVMRSS